MFIGEGEQDTKAKARTYAKFLKQKYIYIYKIDV